MKGLRHIPAPLSALWRELRYRWLPTLVFAGALAGMFFLWGRYLQVEQDNQFLKNSTRSGCFQTPTGIIPLSSQEAGLFPSNMFDHVPGPFR